MPSHGFTHRRIEPELMDDPGIDSADHTLALRGLARINRLSRAAGPLWRALAPLAARSKAAGRPMRVLDLGSGGGDVTLALARRAGRARLDAHWLGLDMSPTAVALARGAAEHAGLADRVAFQRADVLRDPLPPGYDAVVSSLFLHHLPDAAIEALLRRVGETAGFLAVSDLERSRLGYAAAWVGTRGLSRSPVVHVDGPLSVRAALTGDELRRLAEAAGLHGARVRRVFPMRLLLTWSRP